MILVFYTSDQIIQQKSQPKTLSSFQFVIIGIGPEKAVQLER